MSEPAAPADDPVTSEDELYAGIFSEYVGLRKAGAGIFAAAAITGAHLTFTFKVNEA